jgi:hypothetical protein
MKTLTMLNSPLILSIALVASMLVATSSSSQPRSMHESFQEESDYVVIVKARGQKKQLGFDNIPIEIATLEVMAVLKGKIPEKEIEVKVKGESMEITANCCEINKIYLMYLVKTPKGLELIRGRDGVYILEKLHFRGRRR